METGKKGNSGLSSGRVESGVSGGPAAGTGPSIKRAIELYQAALEIQPDHEEALVDMALAYPQVVTSTHRQTFYFEDIRPPVYWVGLTQRLRCG